MANLKYCYGCFFLCIFTMCSYANEICSNDIDDFFYNVNFDGPTFDQSVYAIVPKLSISNPPQTEVFRFEVKPQTNKRRPSFVSMTGINRQASDTVFEPITVTSNHPHFIVKHIINHTFALLTNISPLNYFSPFNRYTFQMIARQTFSNRPAVASVAQVQINLKNDNVHDPVFIPDQQVFYISQATDAGTQFGMVYAVDYDDDIVTYSMSSTEFLIDTSTGVLQLRKPFDASSKAEYLIPVTATDSSSSCPSYPFCQRRAASTEIKIIVTAVNRNSPQFKNEICGQNITFAENNAIGTEIVSLHVFDSDRGANGLVDITFPSEQLRTTTFDFSNTAYRQFYIEQSNQTDHTRVAVLRTNEKFDFDRPGTTRVWYLSLVATDRGKPQRQTFCSLSIHLTDTNDNAPVFLMTSWNYTIYRSSRSKNKTQFLRIIASDADTGINSMIYYYMGTPNVPYFSINRTTGMITLRSDIISLDYMNISRFPVEFYVYAQDCGTPQLKSKTNATVTIYMKDGDNPSVARWLNDAYDQMSISITEKFYENHRNQPIFDHERSFNGSIMYELTSQSSSIMTVHSPFLDNTNLPFREIPVSKNEQIFSTGITVISGLHAELQEYYLLYVRILVNPPLIGSIAIRIKDENDQIPTFDIRSIVISIMEQERGNRTIAQIQAFDRDIDYSNNYVQYRINEDLSDSEAIKHFHLGSDGVIWTTSVFGHETNKTFYRLFITAYNVKPAWNSLINNRQDLQLDVRVISINDRVPIFDINERARNISINETIAQGSEILYLRIVDLDIDTNLNVGILNGNDRNAFQFMIISDNSGNATRTQYEAIGQLKVIGHLDYERKPNYTLMLFAFDTKNIAKLNLTISLIPQNTKAPCFDLTAEFDSYEYTIFEATPYPRLDESSIFVTDPDRPSTRLRYEIFNTNPYLDLSNLFINENNNHITICIREPGLSRDFPFGTSTYRFAIRAIDNDGSGVVTYIPITINVVNINNKAPIPTNFPWIISEGNGQSIKVKFKDYDDPPAYDSIPNSVKIVAPSNFTLDNGQSDIDGFYRLTYNGILNRTITKYLSVTLNASDHENLYNITTIPIIVADERNVYPISNGVKTIRILYADGYQNSLRNILLGSVYVNDLNDWYHTARIYSVRNVSNEQRFNVSNGMLSTSEILLFSSYTINVDVIKPSIEQSAIGTIHIEVEHIDSEYVRQASTIRIRGEYPETLIDLKWGRPIDKLRMAIAFVLLTKIESVKILAIHNVFQYRNPTDPPKPFDVDRSEALTDVIFYVLNFKKYDVDRIVHENLYRFRSHFQINATSSAPNSCHDYHCPMATICRPTRTIRPKPFAIDTNQTSFIGINVVDSADCINATHTVNLTNPQKQCIIAPFNHLLYCSSTKSILPHDSIGPCCEMLGRTFYETGNAYAIFAGERFSNIAPARFSFEFALKSRVVDSLIFLYGPISAPIDDVLWTAIELHQGHLQFHFGKKKLVASRTVINPSTWYHIECQLVDSVVLISINDCQYYLELDYNQRRDHNMSITRLYLGGIPTTDSIQSHVYPELNLQSSFSGCIRNVLSNGYYLDMSQHISSMNSEIDQCPCSFTNSCHTLDKHINNLVPWYTWLVFALVFLSLMTIITMILLTFKQKQQQLKYLSESSLEKTRDNITNYNETAGEEDHSNYNIYVLKKPRLSIADSSHSSSLHDQPTGIDNSYPSIQNWPSLGSYIKEKTNQQVILCVDDTKLRYQYEGDGSIASNLSSIQSSSLQEDYHNKFVYLL